MKVKNQQHLKELLEHNFMAKMNKKLKCKNALQVPILEERPIEYINFVIDEFWKIIKKVRK